MSEILGVCPRNRNHPLTFLVENHDDYPNPIEEVACVACCDSIWSGPVYACGESEEHYNTLYWHKVCGELPRQIKHPIHPEHSLTLSEDWSNFLECECDACGKTSMGLMYQCSQAACGFRLDINCALMAHKVDLDCHPHPLVPLQYPALFHCHACGDKHEGVFYKCSFCSFWVHQNCASQPSDIEHSYHDHPLTLARSPPKEYSIFETICDICNCRILWKSYWVYYCGGCRYFAHLNCVTSKKIPVDQTTRYVLDPNVVFFSLPNDSVSIITQFVNKDSLEDIKVATELDHFGHDHPLALFDGHITDEMCSGSKENLPLLNVENGDKLCKACVQPIAAPFYGCTECNYLLHKCCAELPTQIQNPYKPEHLLDLLPKDTKSVALFLCTCCLKPTNGFVYKCAQCDLCCFDVKCGSLLSRPIKHEAHKHLLFPRVSTGNYIFIDACAEFGKGKVFECHTCDFIIDTYCALLPKALKHRYDEHPFILNYSPIKDHPSEYYCELCEEEVNPKLCFYHCGNCDQSIHTLCALEVTVKSNMGYGASYKFEFHPHPLTFVDFSREYYDRCSHCHERLRGYLSHEHLRDCLSLERLQVHLSPGFECKSCNLKFHFECTEVGMGLKWLELLLWKTLGCCP